MTVALVFQGKVPEPAVGVHHAAKFNCLLEKRHPILGRRVCHTSHPKAPNPLAIFLCRHHDQRLAVRLSPLDALLFAAPVRLVRFHASGKAMGLPAGERQSERTASRWGSERGYCVVIGQKVPIQRPRGEQTRKRSD